MLFPIKMVTLITLNKSALNYLIIKLIRFHNFLLKTKQIFELGKVLNSIKICLFFLLFFLPESVIFNVKYMAVIMSFLEIDALI